MQLFLLSRKLSKQGELFKNYVFLEKKASFLEEVLSSSLLRSTVSSGSLLTSLFVRVKLSNLGG